MKPPNPGQADDLNDDDFFYVNDDDELANDVDKAQDNARDDDSFFYALEENYEGEKDEDGNRQFPSSIRNDKEKPGRPKQGA